jgi:hypothetical protein
MNGRPRAIRSIKFLEPLSFLWILDFRGKRGKGVPVERLRAVLAKLGEAGISENDIPGRVDAVVDEVIELRAQLARLRNERAEARRHPRAGPGAD